MSKGDRKAARIAQRAQQEGAQGKPYGSFEPDGPAANESDFVLCDWTGQAASDAFFALHNEPAFKGVGTDAVLLPPHSLSVSRTPNTSGSVIEAYPHGLAYADQIAGMTGAAAFIALLGLPMLSLYAYSGIADYKIFSVFSSVFGWIVTVVNFLLVYFLLRWDITGYRYAPVLFDRAAGKVHVFFDQTLLFRWLPLWGGGKYEIETYDWSCIRGQVSRSRVFTGNTAQELAALSCVVVRGPQDPTVVAQFEVGGSTNALAVQLLLDRWEHVRRFMEHEGPLFVQDDGPYVPPATQSLWGALCWGQPLIGPGRHAPSVGMVLAQMFTACFVWFTVPFGLVGWLCFHIKEKPKWPAEILASVGGNPLTGKDLEAWRGVVPASNHESGNQKARS
ncbi:hypothetical protein RB25_01075 [Herbaspirillum rubrisubalbicans]|uniref:DUF6708 domain-containing protein n=1 Tax=Herbaspirillum rubrisubalbicans TaxID=80842 RepID=A0ABX9C7B7_9BURK|nr:DUF6708 domain-containing protein [Herbaspirillum rubrisubalbicans]RAM66183.1 hypothetical protein RB24_04165 [Herbaspirillum rubrisubalbicans]RAN50380.1 hypothetical protein RB25_01075 [Herbaspirillum rubrisubalbicans]